jgi:spermidine synthase
LIFRWQFQNTCKHFNIYPNSFFQGCKNHLHSKGLLVHNKLQLYHLQVYKISKHPNRA